MLETRKDLFLKGMCCLIFLQVNGESRGNTQIKASQKQLTHLEKGIPVGQPVRHFPKEALPIETEIKKKKEHKKQNKFFGFEGCFIPKNKGFIQRPFVQRRICMRGK